MISYKRAMQALIIYSCTYGVAKACSARSMNRGPRPLGASDAHG